VKPEGSRPERSNGPAPGDTAAHRAEAGPLWEQFLARENLAEALRRVEQNAGAPGIDGMSTKELRPWLKDRNYSGRGRVMCLGVTWRQARRSATAGRRRWVSGARRVGSKWCGSVEGIAPCESNWVVTTP
jgi:hypothetical protein